MATVDTRNMKSDPFYQMLGAPERTASKYKHLPKLALSFCAGILFMWQIGSAVQQYGRPAQLSIFKPEIYSQNGSMTTNSVVTDEYRPWKEGTVFCNIIGSSKDEPFQSTKGTEKYASWIEAWIDIAESSENPKCSVKDCPNTRKNDPQFVGGHVVRTGVGLSPDYGADDVARLVPLCGKHNAKEEKYFNLRAETKAVRLDNYCKDNSGAKLCQAKRSDETCSDKLPSGNKLDS